MYNTIEDMPTARDSASVQLTRILVDDSTSGILAYNENNDSEPTYVLSLSHQA